MERGHATATKVAKISDFLLSESYNSLIFSTKGELKFAYRQTNNEKYDEVRTYRARRAEAEEGPC